MRVGQTVLVFKTYDFLSKNIFNLLRNGEFKVGVVYNEHTNKDNNDAKSNYTTYAYDKFSALCKDYIYKSSDKNLSEYTFMTKGQVIDLFNMVESKNPARVKQNKELLDHLIKDYFDKR